MKKLNLHWIKDALPDWNLQGNIQDPPYSFRFSRPMFYDKCPDRFCSDILYVMYTKTLPRRDTVSPDISFLCIGRPDEAWQNGASNLLYTEEDASLMDLFNAITLTFFQYHDWQASLQDVINQHLPLQELAVRSSQYIENPMLVQGNNYRILFTYIPTPKNADSNYTFYTENYGYQKRDNSFLNMEELQQNVFNPFKQAADQSSEPQLYQNMAPYQDTPTLFYNVFIEKIQVARIYMDAALRPIRSSDYLALKVLGDYIAKYLENDPISSFTQPENLENTLNQLLSHTWIEEEKIEDILKNFSWKLDDTYVCFILKLHTINGTEASLDVAALNLASGVSDCCFTHFSESIVFICNLSQKKITRDELITQLVPYLRDSLLVASFSASFCNFKHLYHYYCQAVVTEELGIPRNPDLWYYRFEDYHMDYLLQKYTDSIYDGTVIPSGLKDLLDYDIKRGTNYAQLLRVYLDNDRNIAETIKKEYMHRNTFLYQIGKIHKIIHSTLEDPDERILYQLAFRILEHTGQAEKRM